MSLLSRDRFVAVLGASGVGLGRRQGSETLWLGSVGFIDEGFHAWFNADGTLRAGLDFLREEPAHRTPWEQ